MRQVAKIAGINLLVIVIILLMGEGIARYSVRYNPSYYTSVNATDAVIEYPYGIIKRNSQGHPDDEFDLADPRPRIAYVGDSVTMGVGAGHGYRFSDILEQRFPQYQHMTLASIGDSFDSKKYMDGRVAVAKELGTSQFIYFYNLNDTLPTVTAGAGDPAMVRGSPLARTINFVKMRTEFLRNKSYLFNWVRFKGRNALARFGVGYRGEPSYELFPEQNAAVLDDVAERINYLAAKLEKEGIAFTLVLLPYEMQISKDAADTYSRLGIKWDDGFIAGNTQDEIRARLDPGIIVFDARDAFVQAPQDRLNIKTGQYFVYNKGDSLDWNHPNREGHALIANFLQREELFRQLQ
ncbi:MAG: hypothetical protein ACSLFL_15970 [Alphaproteobacteria bacterium]